MLVMPRLRPTGRCAEARMRMRPDAPRPIVGASMCATRARTLRNQTVGTAPGLSTGGRHFGGRRTLGVCKATLDDPELEDLVAQMEAQRPEPPAHRPELQAAFSAIDAANSEDPTIVADPADGRSKPYRVLYSNWVANWVQKLDPKASDELLILAKGKNIESWKLKEIKRDAYPPSSQGVKMWEADRKRWLAERLEAVMKDAGYAEDKVAFVKEVMLGRDIPNPRDIRKYDLVGQMGSINYRTLEQASLIQTLTDAEALVFMEVNFPQMADRMAANDIIAQLKRELGAVSKRCVTLLLKMPWSPVQVKMIGKAFSTPTRLRSIILEAEGTAASSTHPGDWRYRDFSYD